MLRPETNVPPTGGQPPRPTPVPAHAVIPLRRMPGHLLASAGLVTAVWYAGFEVRLAEGQVGGRVGMRVSGLMAARRRSGYPASGISLTCVRMRRGVMAGLASGQLAELGEDGHPLMQQ